MSTGLPLRAPGIKPMRKHVKASQRAEYIHRPTFEGAWDKTMRKHVKACQRVEYVHRPAVEGAWD